MSRGLPNEYTRSSLSRDKIKPHIPGLHADILTQPIPRTNYSYAVRPNKKSYE